MSKSSVPSTAAAPTSSLFGPPHFLEGEDPSAYNELLARVSGRVKPADILERFGVSRRRSHWQFSLAPPWWLI